MQPYEVYGRSPIIDILPQTKKEQELDRTDLEDGSKAAIQRLLRRKLLSWVLLRRKL